MDERTPFPSGQHSIDTPELVAIEFPIAGLGSRFLALLLDYFLQGAVLLALTFALALAGSGSRPGVASPASGNLALALVVLAIFLFHWGYFTLFEAYWNGRTPGKRLVRLRVIQKTGRAIGLFESLSRNLLRVVDFLPSLYIAGAIGIFFSRNKQRIGDLVAGTLVVHERKVEESALENWSTRTFTAAALQPAVELAKTFTMRLPADAVARLSVEDLQLIESFLARRLDLPLEVRASLRERLAAQLCRKMQFSIPEGLTVETFLEDLAQSIRVVGTA